MDDWNARKAFDRYVLDYMLKKKMTKAAESFMEEANITPGDVAINSPDGFLTEWWSLFWDMYNTKLHSQPPTNREEAVKATGNNLQNVSADMAAINPEAMTTVPSSILNTAMYRHMFTHMPEELRNEPIPFLLANTFQQECLKNCVVDQATGVQQHDGVNPILASSNRSSYLPQENAQQNLENAQHWDRREDKRPITFERSNTIVPASGIPDTEMNKCIQQIPVTEHYMTGAGLVSPGLRNQVSHSSISLPNQHQHLPPFGAHFTNGLDLNSPGLGCQIPCSLESLPYQQEFAPFRMSQVETSPVSATQKSRAMISSTSRSPLNPATHMFIDDSSGRDLQNVRSRKIESSFSVATAVLLQDGKEAEEKPMDEDVEAYFPQENDNIDENATLFINLHQNSSPEDTSEPEGFSFKETGSLHSLNNKLLSCHFSSSGNLLAGAGHEKKVLLWNMENYSVNTINGHTDIITDVRFRPNSTIFGTSSFDKTVLIWDTLKRRKPLFEITGHSNPVMSLDFHPKKVDLLCSCDNGNEIRFWNVNNSSWSHTLKGVGTRGRFQPRLGDLLAAATGNYINLIDVETNTVICKLEGHIKDIRSFCWNSSGQYVATVSEDGARIWPVNSGGRWLHALPCSGGNSFESCTFHPAYCQLLVIGSNKSIQLWNPSEKNKAWSYQAHESVVSALAESPYTETIGSASHDQWLKVWK